jgi:hypothetical protein
VDITFNCDNCGQSIVIDEAAAGMAVNCPNCAAALTHPRRLLPRPPIWKTARIVGGRFPSGPRHVPTAARR